MRWAGHVAEMGGKRKVYKLLVQEPEGKKTTKKNKTWVGGQN
jgi:hypothetical protein